jgi:hypothetical protein
VGIAVLLGAEQAGLLLRPAHEQHTLGAGEPSQVLVHHIVFALALGEVDPRQPVVASEAAHRSTERVGDPRQRRSRGDRQPQPTMHVTDQPRGVLQLSTVLTVKVDVRR